MKLRDIDFVVYPPRGVSEEVALAWLNVRGNSIGIEMGLYFQLKRKRILTPDFVKIHIVGAEVPAGEKCRIHPVTLGVQTVEVSFPIAEYDATNCEIQKSRIICNAMEVGVIAIADARGIDTDSLRDMFSKIRRADHSTSISVEKVFRSPQSPYSIRLTCDFFLNRCDVIAHLYRGASDTGARRCVASFRNCSETVVSSLRSAAWIDGTHFRWDGDGIQPPFYVGFSDLLTEDRLPPKTM